MSRKALPLTGLPEEFALTEKTIAHVNERFPTVDIEKSLERFCESALAHGRMYSDWQAAFRTWCRRAIEEKWDGVVFKKGRDQDPRWAPILAEVKPYGFRQPQAHETPGSYRTEFELWKSREKRAAPVIDFGDVLKRA